MSISFCQFCQEKHDDFYWRLVDYEDEKGIKKSGWFCRKAYKPTPDAERIPERIKEDRKKYAKSLIQPYREGQASLEYIQAYPERAKQTFTPQEISKARPVWSDIIGTHWQNSR